MSKPGFALRPFHLLTACGVLALPFVLIAALGAGPALAQSSKPVILQEVKIFGKGEDVHLIFSVPSRLIPDIQITPGYFSLQFNGVGSTKPVRTLHPKQESLYSEIRIEENRFSTKVGFTLHDTGLDLGAGVRYDADGPVFRLHIDPRAAKTAPAQPAAQSTSALPAGKGAQNDIEQLILEEMEKRIGGGAPEGQGGQGGTPAPQAAGSPSESGARNPSVPAEKVVAGGFETGDFFLSLTTMIIALVVIVLALYGTLYLYNRFFANKLARLTGAQSIRQVASFHIGPRQRIVVLEINGEVVACGVTPNQISYLTHLQGTKGGDAPSPGGLPGLPGLTPQGGGDAPTAKKAKPGGAAKKTPAAKGGTQEQAGQKPAQPGDPMQQFAEVLKSKVRSLKRIN
ncbi:MAG: flagellar biosynthetic protein FliO [Deltaproteobacteria bacterium]|nr:flagellar biosynthetic protein FliO [Deltaproteobacteria bacterium]